MHSGQDAFWPGCKVSSIQSWSLSRVKSLRIVLEGALLHSVGRPLPRGYAQRVAKGGGATPRGVPVPPVSS